MSNFAPVTHVPAPQSDGAPSDNGIGTINNDVEGVPPLQWVPNLPVPQEIVYAPASVIHHPQPTQPNDLMQILRYQEPDLQPTVADSSFPAAPPTEASWTENWLNAPSGDLGPVSQPEYFQNNEVQNQEQYENQLQLQTRIQQLEIQMQILYQNQQLHVQQYQFEQYHIQQYQTQQYEYQVQQYQIQQQQNQNQYQHEHEYQHEHHVSSVGPVRGMDRSVRAQARPRPYPATRPNPAVRPSDPMASGGAQGWEDDDVVTYLSTLPNGGEGVENDGADDDDDTSTAKETSVYATPSSDVEKYVEEPNLNRDGDLDGVVEGSVDDIGDYYSRVDHDEAGVNKWEDETGPNKLGHPFLYVCRPTELVTCQNLCDPSDQPDICGKKFKPSELLKHFAQTHQPTLVGDETGSTRFCRCSWNTCRLVLPLDKLMEHTRQHLLNTILCVLCGSEFTMESDAKDHLIKGPIFVEGNDSEDVVGGESACERYQEDMELPEVLRGYGFPDQATQALRRLMPPSLVRG